MGVGFTVIFLPDDDDAAGCLAILVFPCLGGGGLSPSVLVSSVSNNALTFAVGSSFGGDSDLRFSLGFFPSSSGGEGLANLLALAAA